MRSTGGSSLGFIRTFSEPRSFACDSSFRRNFSVSYFDRPALIIA